MDSKDDDTLPLPGLSEELLRDIIADEDIIPTSQPQSSGSSKGSKSTETIFSKTEEAKCLSSDSRVDDTLPPEAIINQSIPDNDKSADFIPDTERKTVKVEYQINEDATCRKKLPVMSTDMFKAEPKPSWSASEGEIPESPAMESVNFTLFSDTPTTARSAKEEESATEIIVNDSGETVDLEETPVKMKNSEEVVVVGLEMSSGSITDVEKSMDNSSVFLLDHTNDNLGKENVKFNRTEEDLQEKVDDFISKPNSPKKTITNSLPVETNCAVSETSTSSVVTRKIDFKLTISCLVTVNTKINKVVQKVILNVNESPKMKRKPNEMEAENLSEKSKEHSTSSSGSVYSDKMGPFALPKRLSSVSDQTDSSEEDFALHVKTGRRALERIHWSNEYLLPLKMDDLVAVALDNQDFLKRPNVITPSKRFKNDHSHPLKEIQENSISDITSVATEETKEIEEFSTKFAEEEEKKPEEIDNSIEKPTVEESTKEKEDKKEEQPIVETKQPEQVENQEKQEEDAASVKLGVGLPVFARWTDKRYYSGVLTESLKNDRWEVKFDDGTSKAVREDFLIPAEWLHVGALVFAVVDDKYESGQIVAINKEEELTYVVELDTEKIKITVKLLDLCLTEVMAGIIREKYKPLGGTPRGKADIDFDNVLSGKRLREQKTPLKPTIDSDNSSKKKSSSKGKKISGLESIKETPQNEPRLVGLKSEEGHLVEDKLTPGESSGMETGETPLRGSEGRKRTKPRSLSYEEDRTQGGSKKSKWLTVDGTPIPGPSGVKQKKQKTKPETPSEGGKSTKKSPGKSKVPQSGGKKKRKLETSVEESLQKKSTKEGEGKGRRKSSRKG